MAKRLKYFFLLLGGIGLLLISIKFERLDKYKAGTSAGEFKASEYALNFWEQILPEKTKDAPQLSDVIEALETKPEEAFKKYSRLLGISKTHYFLFTGEGIIESVEEEFLKVKIDNKRSVKIATDFIFGNAIRDGSGGIDIGEFTNMTDFNNVSIAINKIVKESVIPGIKSTARPGMYLKFTGATEIREEHIDFHTMIIIPVAVTISDAKKE